MPDYEQVARRAARKYGLNEDVFVRQIRQESGFNPHARSPAGATGIAQIMPATAAGWGVNPNDPNASLNAAAKHMAQYVHQYGSYKNALVAYNAGPGRVGKSLPAETQNYIRIILGGSNPSPNISPSAGGSGGASTPTSTSQTITTPGVDNQQERARTFVNYLENGGAGGLLGLHDQLKKMADIPATSKTITTPGTSSSSTSSGSGGSANTSAKGTVKFEGKLVAAWIAPALTYARAHGWKGQVNSGFRSFADQTRIYNSGVRPAAKPGTSNHEGTEFPRGAVDVSDAQQLSNILQHSPYAGKLVYAGPKDPVHFSHPHDGSY